MNPYRSVLEVLKLSDLQSILTATKVSSIWSQAASSEELYREKCELEIFGHNTQVSYPSTKVMYQSYLQTRNHLVLLTENTVRLFSCKTQRRSQKVRLMRPIKLSDFSAWTLLPDGTILTCGGYGLLTLEMWSEAYLVQSTGVVADLAPMIEGRGYHGCVFYEHAVYVFGGVLQTPCSLPTRSSEKLEIVNWPIVPDTPWKRLPDMLCPRSALNPCVYIHCIYLFGNNTAEVFHCAEETYTLLNVTLTSQFPATAITHKEEIVVLQMRKISKWSLERGEFTSSKTLEPDTRHFLSCSSTIPVVVGDRIFFKPQNLQQVLTFDLSANRIMKPFS